MTNHVKSLSKEDRNRHFPDGGKGSCRYRGRLGKGFHNESDKKVRENKFWDNCEFERKKRAKLETQKRGE